jgi:hypothetical protein
MLKTIVAASLAIALVSADAKALWSTSGTQHVIAPGEKTFATQPGKAFSPGSFVLVLSRDPAQPANYMYGRVVRYDGGELTVAVTILQGRGTHADWTIQISGPPGPMSYPPGLPYEWSVNRDASDPGRGRVKVNQEPSRADRLFVSHYDTNHSLVSGVLGSWNASTSKVRGHLRIYVPFAPTFYLEYKVKGAGVSDKWSTFVVEYVTAGHRISIGDPVVLLFRPTGDKGDRGADGVSRTTAGIALGAALLIGGLSIGLLFGWFVRGKKS